ncbi:hypothetical protein AOA80_07660 [Methanomassiliicoccales archaeon RumEn M1]|nr:hypothetical protein AOA80_07660 [Methanomassiliicoccales archaeon RumEn M1]
MAAEREAVLAEVERAVLKIPGVEGMRFLDPELKEEITRLELLAEQNGACGGLMPFRNGGVWAALSREVSLIVVGNAHLIVHNEGLLYMMDTSGQVIGEYVPPHLKERFVKEHPNANFLSDDFVLHSDVTVQGEPYFLIDEVDFPYLENIEGITRLTSGSVSTMSDDMVRSLMGFDGPQRWTHLVGFDLLR